MKIGKEDILQLSNHKDSEIVEKRLKELEGEEIEGIIQGVKFNFKFRLTFNKNTFSFPLKMQDWILSKGIHFENCIFQEDVSIRSAKVAISKNSFGIFFKNCHFIGKITITDSRPNRIGFKNCTVEKELTLTKNERIDQLRIESFESGYSDAYLTVSDLNANYGKLKKIGTLNIGSSFGKYTYIENYIIDKLELNGSLPDDSLLAIRNLKVDQLTLQELIGSAGVELSDIKPTKRTFRSRRAPGPIGYQKPVEKRLNFIKGIIFWLFRIRLGWQFCIQECKIDELFLGSLNLKRWQFVYVKNDVVDISFKNVKWPTRIYNSRLLGSSHARRIYREFKVMAIEQKNIIDKLIFEQMELNAYLQELRSVKTKRGERFILWTNKVFSNYGNAWIKPAVWLLIITSFWFFIIVLCLNDFDIKVSTDVFIDNWAKIFFLINPAHKPDFIFSNIEDSQVALFTDFFSRITSSYLIFLVIRGVRKFSRK